MAKVQGCVVIGGGAAGLTAGLTITRTRRLVTVIDAGKQNNLASHEAHNFFTRDGQEPSSLYPIGQEQFLKYPTSTLLKTSVTDITKNEKGNFVVTTPEQVVESKTIIFAQGMSFILPNIPGVKEIWGTKAWHCPFCHGYEASDHRIIVICRNNADRLPHFIPLIRSWSQKVDYAIDESIVPEPVQKMIKKFGGKIVKPVTRVVDKGDHLVVETEGGQYECDSVVVETDIVPRDNLTDKLGVEKEGNFVKVDAFGRTNVKGVYAAGDQTTPRAQVAIAVGSGSIAAVGVQFDLSEAEAHEYDEAVTNM